MGLNERLLFCKIEDLVVKTIIAGEHIISNATEMFCPFPRYNCFELFGFDVLVDSRLEPWLLEVNLTPALACDSPLDQKIKANVVADLLSLAGVMSMDHRQSEPNQIKKSSVAYTGAPSVHNGLLTKMKSQRRPGKSQGPAPRQQLEGGERSQGQNPGQSAGSKEERLCLRETVDENSRRNFFKRVFPSVDFPYYKQFFEEERPLNHFLDKKLFGKKRLELASAKSQAEKMPLFMQVARQE